MQLTRSSRHNICPVIRSSQTPKYGVFAISGGKSPQRNSGKKDLLDLTYSVNHFSLVVPG